jgi:hypothetical protein
MNKPTTGKKLSTNQSLTRWCLRALHQSCDAMLYNAIHSRNGSESLAYARHQGPPPLRFCCIAPHCQEWHAINDQEGCCCYRERLAKAAAANRLPAAGQRDIKRAAETGSSRP